MEEDASALDSMLEEEPDMPPPRNGIERMRRAELIAEVRHERVRFQAMTKRKDELKAALVTANRLVVDTNRQLREQQSLVQLTITQNDKLTQERDALLQQLQQEVAKNEALRQQALEQDISKDAIVSCILQEQVEQMSSFNDTIRKFDKVATDLEQIRESNNCPICISPWTAEGVHRIVSLKCGHLFGESCVRMHLGCSADCPCCKQSAEVKDLRYLFGIPVLYAAPSQNLQNGAAEGEVPNER